MKQFWLFFVLTALVLSGCAAVSRTPAPKDTTRIAAPKAVRTPALPTVEEAAMRGAPRPDSRVVQSHPIGDDRIVLLRGDSPKVLFATLVKPAGDGWAPTNFIFTPEMTDHGALTVGAFSLQVQGKDHRVLMGETVDQGIRWVTAEAPGGTAHAQIDGGTWIAVVPHTAQPITVRAGADDGQALLSFQR